MRIAFVTPEYITEKNFDGGLSNYLARASQILVEMGHEVVVVVASDVNGEILHGGVKVYRCSTNTNFLLWINRITFWRLKRSLTWILQSWKVNKLCRRLHRSKKLDVIQYASFTSIGLFRLREVPVVVRLSSLESLLQESGQGKNTMDGRLAIRLERWAISRADQVFSPSHFLAKVVSSSLGIPVEVVQTPFKLERHTYDDLPYIDCMKGKAYLLFFGTISFLKGVSTIAKILRTLLNENPDLHFVFIGKDVGYGGRPMMSCVWDLAGSHRGRVLYLGAMRHEQLFPFLANALAVVLPSRIDNFPNACIEAMAFRKIVIGTTGSSFEELIKDGESGFLCPPDSPEELLSTVRKIIALPVSERIRIGKNAARRIEELHPEVTGRKLVEYLTSAAVERIA